MKGEAIRIPIYSAVAWKPFNDAEVPFCSKITAISGNNIPCANPEIKTILTKTENLYVESCMSISFSKQTKPIVQWMQLKVE